MTRFRITVCLTRYYNDERSYCYLGIDNKYKIIRDLEDHLRKTFRIKDIFCLMIGNNLLLSEEAVSIIKEGETVSVIPLQEDWWNEKNSDNTENIDVVDNVVADKNSKKKKKKKSKTEVTNHNEDEAIPVKEQKSVLENSDTESSKKIDSDMDVSMGSAEHQNDFDTKLEDEASDGEENACENQNADERNHNTKMTDMQTAIQQLKQKALTLLGEVATQKQVTGVSGGRINKRKRIRKRNKSVVSVSTPDLSDTASPPLVFKPITKAVSHIRFDNETPQNTLRNSEIQSKPRIVHAVKSSEVHISRSNSISGSSMFGNGDVSRLEDQNAKESSKNNNPTKQKPVITVDKVKKRLAEFPVMDNVHPVVTDLVMFKMLKIGNNYTPVISNEILGTVLEVDKIKDTVKILIVDGHEECQPVKGKFDLDDCKNYQDGELIVDLVWSQVSEPRVIFP